MFGLGMGELIVIVIVALLFVGPDKLPDAAKAIGKGIRDFRRQTQDLQRTLEEDTELGDAVRELKSAFHGVEYQPRQRPANGTAADPPAGGTVGGAASGELTTGADAAGPDSAAAAPDSPPEQQTANSAPAGALGLPTLRAPVGSIPRDDANTYKPPAGDADSSRPQDEDAPGPTANKPAHG